MAMQSPLQRLYKTKFVLTSFVGVVAGYLLMALGNHLDALSGFAFLKAVDLHDIGIVLMTSSLVVVVFTYLGNEDAEREAKRQFREAIRDETPAIRDSVIEAMAFTPDRVLDVLASPVVDRVVENSLAKQLGSREFAADVYADLKAQLLRSTERWRNLRISVNLSSWDNPSKLTASMLTATFRYDYHASNLGEVLRFASVSDRDEYRRLQADPTYTEVWYVGSSSGLDGAAPDAFELMGVSVNDQQQKVTRSSKAGAQFFSVYLDPELRWTRKEAVVSFTYRGLVLRHGHLLYIDLTKPVKGLTISLTYGGTGIGHISVVDYIAAAKQPAIFQLPSSDPSPSVGVTFDGWVLPKGGVAFVWVLDGETAANTAAADTSRHARSTT